MTENNNQTAAADGGNKPQNKKKTQAEPKALSAEEIRKLVQEVLEVDNEDPSIPPGCVKIRIVMTVEDRESILHEIPTELLVPDWNEARAANSNKEMATSWIAGGVKYMQQSVVRLLNTIADRAHQEAIAKEKADDDTDEPDVKQLPDPEEYLAQIADSSDDGDSEEIDIPDYADDDEITDSEIFKQSQDEMTRKAEEAEKVETEEKPK